MHVAVWTSGIVEADIWAQGGTLLTIVVIFLEYFFDDNFGRGEPVSWTNPTNGRS